jgi:hypothetical protein
MTKTIASCPYNPRFILAEPLEEVDEKISKTETERIWKEISEAGCALPSSPEQLKLYYRKSSPQRLNKELPTTSNIETIVLDANCCVLCIPFRDGYWAIDVNTVNEQQQNTNNLSRKQQTSSSSSSATIPTIIVQAVAFTSAEKLILRNSELFSNARLEYSSDDSSLFSLLRRADIVFKS